MQSVGSSKGLWEIAYLQEDRCDRAAQAACSAVPFTRQEPSKASQACPGPAAGRPQAGSSGQGWAV